MKRWNKQLKRLVRFIHLVKKGAFPNARTFCDELHHSDLLNNTNLGCSEKTIKRDIEFLKTQMNAPLEYDPAEHGYFLYAPDWTFPELALSGDELFTEMLTRKISAPSLLPSLKEHIGVEVQLTTGMNDHNVSALNSLICATGKVIPVANDISQEILSAWKNCQQVKAVYAKKKGHSEERTLDIHALFLSDKVWYCQAWCHKRQDFRSFCLHKFTSICTQEKLFKRNNKLISELQNGRFFNLKMLHNIELLCAKEQAEYISEGDWFDGQSYDFLDNGTLVMKVSSAPERAIKSWVSSFNGNVEVLAPLQLRRDIYEGALKLLEKHRD